MTRRWTRGRVLAVMLAVTNGGCAYYRLGADGPGHVDLDRPPPALAVPGISELPRPPRDPALVVSPGVLLGTGARTGVNGLSAESGLGFELSAHLATLSMAERSVPGERREYGLRGPAWGVNLGVTPSALRTGQTRQRQPLLYLEAQRRDEGPGLAAGVALSPAELSRASTGVQVVPLFGPLYGRLQLLLDGTLSLEVGLTIKAPLVFSRPR